MLNLSSCPPTPTPTHVLVVDDDRDIRALTRMALEDADCQVYEAAEGAAALRLLRASVQPLVVLLDLQMPGMNGQHVLEAVVADEILAARHAYLLVTALPAARLPPSLLALLTQVRAPVLTKPVALDTLVDMVAQAAARLPAEAALALRPPTRLDD